MPIVRATSEGHSDTVPAAAHAFFSLMLKASLIAIPAYLGLFMIAVPFDVDAGVERGLVLATPVFEFVVAGGIYAIGFLRVVPDSDREPLASSSPLRLRTRRRTMTLMVLGSAPFLLAVLSGTLLLLKARL